LWSWIFDFDHLGNLLLHIDFAENEVYNVDVIVSSGDGKTKQLEARTTVYKKTDVTYMLKMKTSRTVFSEVAGKFGLFAFTVRALEDEKKGRMGLIECANHNLVKPYDVLYEKDGEVIAQFKYTVLLTASGITKITSAPFDQDLVKSEHSIKDESILALLKESTTKKKANKKKKNGSKKTEDGASGGAAASATEEEADGDEGDEA